jgi:hypothetical protein
LSTHFAEDLKARLLAQGAASSHLARIDGLTALAAQESAVVAMALVGSFAKGCGDRLSDLDLVVFVEPGAARRVLDSAQALLQAEPVMNAFCGQHFWKGIYLDFSSVELHVFETPTGFRLKHPYLPVWDPRGQLAASTVDGAPIEHKDFVAYEFGDDGLIWDLLDCIKWLSRGDAALAKHHIEKIAAEIARERSVVQPPSDAESPR